MADSVSVNTAYDVIEVVDPTTSLPVFITEDNIQVGSGVDEVSITVGVDSITLSDSTAVLEVVDEQAVIQPAVGDVHIQIMEDSEMTWARRTDFVGDDVVYRGEASVGSTESSSVWRIRKLTIAEDGDVAETWAGGTANFDKIWNDRASEVYS